LLDPGTRKSTPFMPHPQHAPAWFADTTLPAFTALTADEHVDVAIVGAGIAGLTTAYLLGAAGKTVAVLDDGPIADGMSAMTTAHLACVLDDRFVEMERLHGAEGARLAAASHAAAIDRIESIVRAEQIDCGFERLDGWLFQPPGADVDALDREAEAARRAGLDVERLPRTPWAGFDTGPSLRFPRQGQFHPLRYLAGLARAIVRSGGRIFTDTHVTRVSGGSAAALQAGGHTVRAGAVVVATNTPVNNRLVLHTKQAAYMTYVIAAALPPDAVPRGLYWDTADPYHYVRLHTLADGAQLLIVGGEDHKTGQAADTMQRHARLEQWARQRFPALGAVQHRWAGQVMETVDGLAFIGRNPLDDANVYVATGDSGMGMTHGTIAGMLLTDLIVGRANPWTSLYEPARKTLRALPTYTHENVNMAAQYRDWLTPGDVDSIEQVPIGGGATIRSGLTKHAVHRDDQGTAHCFSAICPHLGGLVHWNASEQTFDCPCHGSRFSALGAVIHGPANRGLTPIERPAARAAGHVVP
jgi:glycine/D-amino acid oxidase-like deaminating enzyme/nitrite reductase/ring-hydroxylating ferredoxin subunit